jgi:hypothetical protein
MIINQITVLLTVDDPYQEALDKVTVGAATSAFIEGWMMSYNMILYPVFHGIVRCIVKNSNIFEII